MRRLALSRPPLLLALALALSACDREEPRAAESDVEEAASEVEALDPALASLLPQGVTLEMAEEGRKLFPICATCHGFDARGTQLGPSLADSQWTHGDEFEQIRQVIVQGVAEPEDFPVPMPVHGGGAFTDEQIQALTAYVYLVARRDG